MKAVTPVIALVMLLLITVGIVGASYIWLNGVISSSTKKSISLPSGGVYCADGDMKVYVLNNGDSNLTMSDILIAQVDNISLLDTPFIGDMKTGLVGYWKFNEGTGGMTSDSSGNGNTGTLVNGPQWIVGKSGNALNFNGVNNYVDVGSGSILNSPSISNAATIELWVFPKSFASNSLVFYKPNAYFVDLKTDGTVRWLIYEHPPYQGLFDLSTTSTLNLNQWNHIVATYNGSLSSNNAKIYLNGVFQTSAPFTSGKTIYSPGDSPQDLQIADTAFNGFIDEVKLYNKTLGDLSIQPGKSGLVIIYPAVPGKHTIRIGTSSTVLEYSIACD